MNTYDFDVINADPLHHFLMTVPDRKFYLRIGVYDTVQNQFRPYNANYAFKKVAQELNKEPEKGMIQIMVVTNPMELIRPRYVLTITPYDEEKLLCVRTKIEEVNGDRIGQ